VLAPAARRLEVVEAAPEVIVVAPYVFADDRNPRGLPIHHQAGRCTGPKGGCRPRLVATCAGCGRDLNLCMATQAEVDALKRGDWRCGECREVRDA
jgi:hypothetical protein